MKKTTVAVDHDTYQKLKNFKGSLREAVIHFFSKALQLDRTGQKRIYDLYLQEYARAIPAENRKIVTLYLDEKKKRALVDSLSEVMRTFQPDVSIRVSPLIRGVVKGVPYEPEQHETSR